MSKLEWWNVLECTTRWGPDMVVADVALSKNETLFLYKHRDAPEPTAEMLGFVDSGGDSTSTWYRSGKAPMFRGGFCDGATGSITPRTGAGELVEARKRMEQSIFNATTKAVNDFQRETGLTPCDIAVDLISIEPIGQPPYRLVNAVKARVEL